MSDNRKKRKLQEEEAEDVRGGMKIVYKDDDPEELSWWEKFLKVLFKST